MPESRNPSITVIIPTYNEQEGIGPTIEDMKESVNFKSLIVIDGNSTDKTAEIAERMGANVILQRGKGKGSAVAQVIRQVNSDTKYVVLTDADHTYPAEHIPKMIRIIEKNPDVGMVIGNRFNPKLIYAQAQKVVNNILYFGNRTIALTQYLINGVKLMDPLSGLRVIRWKSIKDWNPKSVGFDIEVEMNHYIKRQGYHTVEIPIHYRPRLGAKKLRISDGFVILKRILTESFMIEGKTIQPFIR